MYGSIDIILYLYERGGRIMKRTKKIIPILIIFTMIFPFIPFQVFAQEFGEGTITFQFDIASPDILDKSFVEQFNKSI